MELNVLKNMNFKKKMIAFGLGKFNEQMSRVDLDLFEEQMDIIIEDEGFTRPLLSDGDIYSLVVDCVDSVKHLAFLGCVCKGFKEPCASKLQPFKDKFYIQHYCWELFSTLVSKHFMLVELNHPHKHPNLDVSLNTRKLFDNRKRINELLAFKKFEWIDEINSLIDYSIKFDLEFGCDSHKVFLVLNAVHEDLNKIIEGIYLAFE